MTLDESDKGNDTSNSAVIEIYFWKHRPVLKPWLKNKNEKTEGAKQYKQ